MPLKSQKMFYHMITEHLLTTVSYSIMSSTSQANVGAQCYFSVQFLLSVANLLACVELTNRTIHRASVSSAAAQC